MNLKLSKPPFFLIILLSLTLFFSLTLKAYSATKLIAQGSNFQLYFPTNTAFSIQHLATTYTSAYIFNVTVSSGTLNGTNGYLRMWQDSGEMSFRSQDTATLTAPEVAIIVNGNLYEEQASIVNGDNVLLKWAVPEVLQPLLPIMFGLGMLGLAGTFAGPLYGIHLIKQKKYYDGFISGLIITSFSLALLISWLWQ